MIISKINSSGNNRESAGGSPTSMLQKKNRLLKNTDFERIIGRGRAIAGGDLLLKYVKTDNPQPRFGFVISTKVSKKATDRNLLKRRMREIIRGGAETIGGGHDFVFIARKSVLNLSFSELKSEITELLGKIR